MNKIIVTFVILATHWVSAQNVSLTVQVLGFKNNNGKVCVGLYNSEGTFLKETFLTMNAEIVDQKATVVFQNVPAGDYAVSLYHDENNSGILEKGAFGIPKEDFACSNNAKGKMGPPKYNDAKFSLTETKTITITLNK
ncbi:DUF2141 domain-containing protein [Flavobacterium aciduliphilum]|uniref:Uncharacterized protein (DUF2141 family) n=1 Tax=Flavobacterium aciduliphilum TaxID=1101402 RepID=A0A328Y7U3_9FLAO|nr:DUF2141 domain-containing protein [Flavobacterium aciduliphilum]RAR70108.1 uncharacterized protein (DUF2141 family) [Flavobacterium aciduliphilum]